MLVLYTMYVQVAVVSVGSRIAFEALILFIPLLWPFLMMLVMNSDPTRDNLIAVLSGQMQLVVAYLIGKAAVAMVRVSVARQVETQQQSFDQFFNFLHSHVKAGIAAVKAEQPNVPAMLDKLEELEQAVSERRIEMLLMRDQIPLAVVISERIRAFIGSLQIMESPRVGILTVAGPIGVLISRALGDLLKNAVVHGGHEVRINCLIDDDGHLSLTVTDDGAGFDPVVMDDPSKSLYRLRSDAKSLGGDVVPHMTDQGTTMTLTVPL
jgi:signal transduction histidine kinase